IEVKCDADIATNILFLNQFRPICHRDRKRNADSAPLHRNGQFSLAHDQITLWTHRSRCNRRRTGRHSVVRDVLVPSSKREHKRTISLEAAKWNIVLSCSLEIVELVDCRCWGGVEEATCNVQGEIVLATRPDARFQDARDS